MILIREKCSKVRVIKKVSDLTSLERKAVILAL